MAEAEAYDNVHHIYTALPALPTPRLEALFTAVSATAAGLGRQLRRLRTSLTECVMI